MQIKCIVLFSARRFRSWLEKSVFFIFFSQQHENPSYFFSEHFSFFSAYQKYRTLQKTCCPGNSTARGPEKRSNDLCTLQPETPKTTSQTFRREKIQKIVATNSGQLQSYKSTWSATIAASAVITAVILVALSPRNALGLKRHYVEQKTSNATGLVLRAVSRSSDVSADGG